MLNPTNFAFLHMVLACFSPLPDRLPVEISKEHHQRTLADLPATSSGFQRVNQQAASGNQPRLVFFFSGENPWDMVCTTGINHGFWSWFTMKSGWINSPEKFCHVGIVSPILTPPFSNRPGPLTGKLRSQQLAESKCLKRIFFSHAMSASSYQIWWVTTMYPWYHVHHVPLVTTKSADK